MPDLEAELASLKAEAAKASQRLAAAEANRDRAQEAVTGIVRQLKEEHGVSSVGEAKELLGKLEVAVREEMDKIVKSLDRINGS